MERNNNGTSTTEPLLSQYQPDIQEADNTTRSFSNIDRLSQGDKSLFPIQLKVENLNYSIKSTKILSNVSCCFSPGQCTAIMGPSGAGKTTLLNVLLGNTGGDLEGKVLLNNVPQSKVKRGIKQVSSYVPQEDILLAALTPRETLQYTARLRLPSSMSTQQKFDRVEEVLKQLALVGCADTRVGDVERRGISGGQRKRVSIGTELLINPSVMFVDEPTSGLDSAMAEGVTGLLAELAHEGRTMICTIHQPSYRIFMGFDRLVLLSRGMICYSGPTAAAEDYFSRLGLDPPKHENPVDFYMRELLDEKKGPYLTSCWSHNDEENQRLESSGLVNILAPSEEQIMELNKRDYMTSRWTQFGVLLERFFVDTFKDPDKFWAGLLLKSTVGILQGLVWMNQAGTTQDSIFPVTGVLFAATMSCVMDTLFATVMRFPLQRSLLLREYRNGVYSLPSYYAALLLSSMLFQSFYALFMGIPIYFLVGLQNSFVKVMLFLGNMCILSCIGASLGLLIGCLVKDVAGAQQAVMPTVIPLLLFGGYVIPYNKIPIYFKWLYWLSYFQYAYSIFSINQFYDVKFTDCDHSIISECPVACFESGEQYLDTVNNKFSDLPRDFAAVAGFYALFVMVGYYIMKKLCSEKTN